MAEEVQHMPIQLSEEDQRLLSVFKKQNVVLKVGKERINVKKEQLMAESVVFEKMFNSNFKEARAAEISFPEKDPVTFSRFLRYLLPGFKDQLEEEIVHEILPLVHEYQADNLLKRLDTKLADVTKTKGDNITSGEIIDNILEAEKYDMPEYLVECINVASRKMYDRLTDICEYVNITQDTKFKICRQRVSQIDSKFKQYDQYDQGYFFSGSRSCPCGIHQYMQQN